MFPNVEMQQDRTQVSEAEMFQPQRNPMHPPHGPCTQPRSALTKNNNHSWNEMVAQTEHTRVQNQQDVGERGRHGSHQQHVATSSTHLADVKTPLGKKYPCTGCDKNFSHISNLKKHQRLHTGEKPFLCKHCGKRFNQSAHLKTHLRLHTGEKPFRCVQCHMGFSQVDNLRTHEVIHLGQKPLHCKHCDKTFTRPDTLRRHQRVHNEEGPKPAHPKKDVSIAVSTGEGHFHCVKTSPEWVSWHACFNDML